MMPLCPLPGRQSNLRQSKAPGPPGVCVETLAHASPWGWGHLPETWQPGRESRGRLRLLALGLGKPMTGALDPEQPQHVPTLETSCKHVLF